MQVAIKLIVVQQIMCNINYSVLLHTMSMLIAVNIM